MMKWFFSVMILISVIFGVLNKRMDIITNAAIQDCGNAVNMSISLMGTMCLWSGVMRVAQKSGLTTSISKLLSPITRFIFKGLDKSSDAMQCITMNITANLLGLGNAATPLGIKAMQELQKLQPEAEKHVASNYMIMLVVMNTASIQLIPTTIATLRYTAGSQNPMEILPAILICSVITLTFGITLAKIFSLKKSK